MAFYNVDEYGSPEYFKRIGDTFMAAMQPYFQTGKQRTMEMMSQAGGLRSSATPEVYTSQVEAPAMGRLQQLLGEEQLQASRYAAELPFKEAQYTGKYKGQYIDPAEKAAQQAGFPSAWHMALYIEDPDTYTSLFGPKPTAPARTSVGSVGGIRGY